MFCLVNYQSFFTHTVTDISDFYINTNILLDGVFLLNGCTTSQFMFINFTTCAIDFIKCDSKVTSFVPK